jgi:hypothetical protein
MTSIIADWARKHGVDLVVIGPFTRRLNAIRRWSDSMTLEDFLAKWLPHRVPMLQMQHDGADRMAMSIVYGSVVHLGPSGLRTWAKLMTEAADQIEYTPGRRANSVRCVPRW